MLDGFEGADRNFALPCGQAIHFRPEADRVAQFVFGNLAQPLVVFAEDESSSFFSHALAVAIENGITNIFFFDGQVSGRGCQVRAHGQANQVVGVGHGVSFVEVVNAPNQAAFNVAPRAEVLHMQVADSQYTRTCGQLRTNLGPHLRPTVIRGTQERKYRGFHILVFEAKVRLDDVGVVAEPVFKLTRGFDDVHTEATIARGGVGSQTAGSGLPASGLGLPTAARPRSGLRESLSQLRRGHWGHLPNLLTLYHADLLYSLTSISHS